MSLAVDAWVARFDNGPQAGQECVFVVGPVWQWIEVAPMPEPQGWALVGGEGLGAAEHPWPGQTKYWLTYVDHGGSDPIAHYRS